MRSSESGAVFRRLPITILSRVSRACAVFSILCGLVAGLPAQTQADRPPPMMADESGDRARQLDLTDFAVDVRIMGSLARTTLSMTFYNPDARPVAGNLYVPLPVDATVSSYALDVGGIMVEGVPVERDQGRQVFRTIMARGVDPGLVEWTRGNVFRTRVFPVPGRGTRTVRLSFLSTTEQPAVASASPRYILPLDFIRPVKRFRLSVEVVKPQVRPVVTQGPWQTLAFLNWRDGYRTEFSASDVLLDKDCVIELPRLPESPAILETAGNTAGYFLWSATLSDLDGSRTAATAPARTAPPRHITLYWDASMSRKDVRHADVLKTLELWLSVLPADKDRKLDLVVFRERSEAARRYAIGNGATAGLLKDIQGLVYDGATRFAGLLQPDRQSDFVILVSDGLSTMGSGGAIRFKPPVPAFVLTADSRLDTAELRAIVGLTGGRVIQVKDPAAASRELGQVGFGYLGSSVAEGKAADIEVSVDEARNLVTVTGRLESPRARIVVRFGPRAATERSIELSLQQAVGAGIDTIHPRGMLGTYGAQMRLARLVSEPDADSAASRERIRDLGLNWGLVTPGTSLIVLESLAQYVEFRIPPPESLADMRRGYLAQIAQIDAQKKKVRESHLDAVFSLWQERIQWWNTVFTYPADYRWQDQRDSERGGEGGDSGQNLPSQAMDTEADSFRSAEETISDALAADGAPAGVASEKNAEATSESAPSVTIQAWQPDTPYLRELLAIAGEKPRSGDTGTAGTQRPAALDSANTARAYERYISLRSGYERSPGFYFDVGDFFEARGARDQAIRIWSVLAEMDLEAPGLLRILGYRLSQAGETALAKEVFEQVLTMRPEEPQSYRDLGLILDKMNLHAEAVGLLWQVVSREWANTPEIELVALMELNAAASRAQAAGQRIPAEVETRFIKNLDTDIRIVLTWDTDLSDMDLWVIEPSGEKAYYGHRQTRVGGLVSHDITNGYGPEEYLIRKAMKGLYTIKVDYFGNGNPEVTGTVTLQVEVITNFGRANENRHALTLSLQGAEDNYTVGEIRW